LEELPFNLYIMKKKILFNLLCISLLVASGCNKNDDDNMTDNPIICLKGIDSYTIEAINENTLIDCSDCPFDCQEVFSEEIRYDYFYPVFNPNDKDEIAYLRFDNTTWGVEHELWKLNLCTGEHLLLSENAAYGLSWSVKEWLIYTGVDQQIWKVKSNGDSLTQMTFSGDYNRHPKWNPGGDKYLYNTQNSSDNWYIISNEKGEPIDTIVELETSAHYNWIDTDKISFLTSNGSTSFLQYIELTDYSIYSILGIDHSQGHDSLVQSTSGLLSENSIVWCAIKVIGKTDMNTGQTTYLKSGFSNRRYWFLDVSRDNSHLLFARQDRYQIDECNYDSEYRIFIMDTNGENERKINIPE
jgi:hypothetical protein